MSVFSLRLAYVLKLFSAMIVSTTCPLSSSFPDFFFFSWKRQCTMFDSRNRGKAEYFRGSGSSVFCYLNYKKVKTMNMEHNLDCKTVAPSDFLWLQK